ncbi:MAG: 23S rRNA (uracil(1939)-C(5))-methyltransferase RlmD [Candidatus Gracilibacteria bacterium]|jgi:23S rRNA (uracil-5-)-methyltransferase RumA
MQYKKGQIVEVEISSIAFGGRGIGKYEGITCFVDNTMPGDVVRASFTRIKPNFFEAKLVEIISPSKERCTPKCKYFGICGGCQFQFMPYEKQLEMKEQQVKDAFERIGKIKNASTVPIGRQVSKIIGSKNLYYYRNKMEFSFGYDRDMKFAVGMHLPNRRFDILDLHECHLESEFSSKTVNKTRDFFAEKKLEPFKYTDGSGFLKSLYVREGKRTNEVMINIVTSDNLPNDAEKIMKEYANILSSDDMREGDKKITSVYWTMIIAKKGVVKTSKEILLYGKKSLTEKMILENEDSMVFEILPQAFFQVNTFQAEVLYSQVIRMAGYKPQKTIFDLFCGTGTIGLFLSKHAEQVYGIELIEDSVKIARENAQKNKIFNIDFFTGDVDKLLKNLKEPPSLIVIDPPRIGITQETVKLINDFSPHQLIYVSCNPATLARDCAWLLEYGYKIKEIQPVDMFPHTYHIECVVLLER